MKIWLPLMVFLNAILSISAYSAGCDDVHCAKGEECALVTVMCIRAPCPPIPTCSPIAYKKRAYGECEVNHCAKNQNCVSHEVQCKKAPCPAQEECVDRK
jgi:hypothetical protein